MNSQNQKLHTPNSHKSVPKTYSYINILSNFLLDTKTTSPRKPYLNKKHSFTPNKINKNSSNKRRQSANRIQIKCNVSNSHSMERNVRKKGQKNKSKKMRIQQNDKMLKRKENLLYKICKTEHKSSKEKIFKNSKSENKSRQKRFVKKQLKEDEVRFLQFEDILNSQSTDRINGETDMICDPMEDLRLTISKFKNRIRKEKEKILKALSMRDSHFSQKTIKQATDGPKNQHQKVKKTKNLKNTIKSSPKGKISKQIKTKI